MFYENVPRWIREIPEHFKTQEMCGGAMRIESCSLEHVPDHFKTQEMCDEAVRREPFILHYVLDHLETQRCMTR